MITYRGNPLVKGKIFTIEGYNDKLDNKPLKFIKRVKDGYIFTCEGEEITINDTTIKQLKEATFVKVNHRVYLK